MAAAENHSQGLAQSAISDLTVSPFIPAGRVEVRAERSSERLHRHVTANFQFVWRILRRLGVSEQATDDICQEVFVVFSTKLDHVEVGKERSFLFGTALRLARQELRARATLRELPNDDAIDREVNVDPGADDLVDEKRQRELLDKLLGGMPEQLRTVFVLFELEGLSSAEVAEFLDLPIGTVGSRLRRAREQFHARAARLRGRHGGIEGEP